MAQPSTPPALLSRQQLRVTLTEWHRASSDAHPMPFPGPLANKFVLDRWLDLIERLAVACANLHPLQWANAALSWIPEAPRGRVGFREKLLKHMREKRQRRELLADRFWSWNNFRRIFSEKCASEVVKRRVKIGATAVGSAVLAPAAGIAVLGILGFTSGGIAAGSIAAGIQSAVYGGATGGLFSIAQGIGARAAFPVIVNVVAGAVGGARAATASRAANEGQQLREVGDIGDDP